MNKQELIEKYKNKYPVISVDVKEFRYFIELWKDVKLLDEPQKVKIPQFVADWIEDCKTKGKSLLKSLLYTPGKVNSWVDDPDNQETFALAWINGYEVEQEKRYTVKLKNTDDYLVKTAANSYRFYNNIYTQNRKHTKEEIEKSGFGWVFDCEGIEVEKVEE